MSRAVELKIAGQAYRVVTSASATELARLAETVEDALAQVTPKGRQPSPQSMLLASVTLAHELEEERARYRELEERYRQTLTELLGQVDRLLGAEEPVPALASSSRQASHANK
jgi:cell division protein ZapA